VVQKEQRSIDHQDILQQLPVSKNSYEIPPNLIIRDEDEPRELRGSYWYPVLLWVLGLLCFPVGLLCRIVVVQVDKAGLYPVSPAAVVLLQMFWWSVGVALLFWAYMKAEPPAWAFSCSLALAMIVFCCCGILCSFPHALLP
jgi:hypothetical protein